MKPINNTSKNLYFSYIRPFILYSLNKLERCGIVYSRYIAYVIELDKHYPTKEPAKGAGVEIRICKDQDFRDFPLQKGEIFAERLRMGNHAIGAFRQEKLVGYFWISLGPVYEPCIKGDVHPKGAYIRDGYTLPEVRGTGIGKWMMFYTLRHIKDTMGVDKVCSMTRPDNYPVIRLFNSFGFTPWKMVTFYSLFGLSKRSVKSV